MGILSIVTNTAGQAGAHPRRVKIITTDDLATVTAPNYLNQTHNSGYPMLDTDIVDMDHSYNSITRSGIYEEFLVSINGGNVILTRTSFAPTTSVVGDAVIFVDTTGHIGSAGSAPVVVAKEESQTISIDTTLTSPNIATLTGSVTKTGTFMNDGVLIGLSGAVICETAATGGFLYGVKGKVTLTGTVTGGANVSAIRGELNVNGIDLSLAIVSLLSLDMGSVAEPGVSSELYGIILTNSTQAIANAQLFLYGAADNLLELVDNNAVAGVTYFVPAGTSPGSAGDATKCNADDVLKIKINGFDYWIPLFASNF